MAAINPECFYNLFVAAPAVVTDYQIPFCHIIRISVSGNNSCLQYGNYRNETSSFDPPYNYSYQCSSRFVTSYSPAFVFLCLFDGLVVPLTHLLLAKMYKYGVDNNQYWSKYLLKVIPLIFNIEHIIYIFI